MARQPIASEDLENDQRGHVEALQIRVHGAAYLPALIYLPGLHGDWTLIGDFRKHVAGKVRFVEFVYPRTLTWSLDAYAVVIESALARNGVNCGWLLGESYGSQIVWAMVARKKFSAQGIILAGGFVKHPLCWGVRFTQAFIGLMPSSPVTWLISRSTKLLRWRYRNAPEILSNLDEFMVRRTELDRQAALHRLDQIAANDPRATARNTALPIFYLSGWFDPIVPWPLVRRWLRKNCPSLRGDEIIFTGDHNILGTAHAKAARHILTWMKC